MSENRKTGLLVLAAALATSGAIAADDKPDIENGKDYFALQCGICHAVDKEPGGPVMGPNMVGLVGRKAGSLPDFTLYTAGMKAYNVKWSAKTLDEFLENPPKKVEGTTMPGVITDPKIRADVIAYLATLKK